jgi:hypothetical protein
MSELANPQRPSTATPDGQDQPTPMELAQRGLWVFPVDHPELPVCAGVGEKHDSRRCEEQGKRGKCPANKWGSGATRAPANIAAMFGGLLRNVGIHCGKSGLLVVDEDKAGEFQRFADKHGHTIPATYTVATAKGKHYYFRDTENGRLGIHEGAFEDYEINIRSGNGFVVGPGSVHATGVVYTENGVRGYADVPAWVVEAIDKPKNKPKGEDGHYEGFALPEVIPFRKRDNTLIRYAGHLLALSVPRWEAELLMRAAHARCEQPPIAPDRYPVEEALEKLDRYQPGRSEGYEAKGESRRVDASAATQRVLLTPASEIKARRVWWLWDARLAIGTLALLAGREGLGKSILAYTLAAMITRGELPGEHFGASRAVLVAATEDSWSQTIVPRLIAAGADLALVFKIESWTSTCTANWICPWISSECAMPWSRPVPRS